VHRRIWWLFTLWGLACGIIVARLAALSLGPVSAIVAFGRWQDALSARAELEHYRLWQIDDGRGRILYRSGAPWSGRLRPAFVGAGTVRMPVHLHDEQSVPPADPVVGEVGLPQVWPDPHRAVAEQGRSGLELAFDPWLTGRRAGYLGFLLDAAGGLVPGQPVFMMPPLRGDDLRTTVDAAWERVVTDTVKRPGIPKTALVILDVTTGDVLAIGGRDQASPAAIPAVSAEVPGSVFKLVTAMAALESFRYLPDSRFWCDGAAHVPGVRMKCWTTHGAETLMQALAESCDAAFAEVGAGVGRRAIDTIADRLGLTGAGLAKAGARAPLWEAEKGVIFRRSGDDPGLLANTAIGQQDVRLSPLQAARIAAAIANGGLAREARLVQGVERGGRMRLSFPSPAPHRACASFTASILARSMRMAVVLPSGTAHALVQERPALAVKTGTAELPDGRVNAWMVGFLPYNHPRLAFCAFAGDASEAVAHRAVLEMVHDVSAAYRAFYGTFSA
jgi:cell division protein FtsI/penicillin-binding protein 2